MFQTLDSLPESRPLRPTAWPAPPAESAAEKLAAEVRDDPVRILVGARQHQAVLPILRIGSLDDQVDLAVAVQPAAPNARRT